MKKQTLVSLLLVLMLLVFTACGGETETPAESPEAEATSAPEGGETSDLAIADDYEIAIKGEGVDIVITGADLKAMELETVETSSVSSTGEVTEVTFDGVNIATILEANGVNIADVGGLTFTAADGYVMNVPAEEYAESGAYIIVTYNDEILETPRSAVPDKRAMFWVKDLSMIELGTGGGATASETVEAAVSEVQFFFENATTLTPETLDYDGTMVESYSLQAYFDAFLPENEAEVFTLTARDGHEKTENADVFFTCYVSKLEGSEDMETNAPQYFSETLNLGMRVKQLDIIEAGTTAIYFGTETDVATLLETLGMTGYAEYNFIASDGYETLIPVEAIEFGMIYPDEEEGYIRASFDGYDFGDAKGGGKVKYLASIAPVGEKIGAPEGGMVESGVVEETSAPISGALLTITVGGETVGITEEDFMALPQVEHEISRTNSFGETVVGTYKGVHWTEIANFAGADAESTITVIASDGYEIKLTPDMLNDEQSMFALYQDGEYIESDGDGRVWFAVSENFTANNWAKFIVSIIVD